MTVDDRLAELGIVLPATTAPVANYVSTRRSGSLLFVSGHVSRRGGAVVPGKVGDDIDTDAAYELARLAALDILGTVVQEQDIASANAKLAEYAFVERDVRLVEERRRRGRRA